MRENGSPFAVGVTFALAGASFTSALARMPSIRDNVGASATQLSFALVCVGIGSIAAMPFTGRLSERYSSKRVVQGFGAVGLAAWALIANAPNVATLAPAMFLFGIGAGVWDVAMNIQAHTVEQRQGRVLMPKWHAVFSFGAVGGAALGALFAKLGIPIEWQFPVVSAASFVLLIWATAQFVPDQHGHEILPETAEIGRSSAETPPGNATRGLTRVEILIGLMMLGTALGEGAANDWLSLMLVDTRDVPEAFGALALAGFNLTMAVGRLASTRYVERWGRVPVLRASGLTAAAGVTVLCLVDHPTTALLGAAAWGLGLAVVFPTGISAAGEIEGRGPRAIAAVSTLGYGGFLLGAPLIGQLAHFAPLDRALLVVAAMGVLIAVLAPAARERTNVKA